MTLPGSSTAEGNRPLSDAECRLVRWMLEHGTPEGRNFRPQLQLAEVTPWRCPCGCASINFQIRGHPEAPPGMHVLGDFLFGSDENLSGIFVFESGGLLSGIEVYGLAGKAPRSLPTLDQLRPFVAGPERPS